MINFYKPELAIVKKIKKETPQVKLFTIAPKNPQILENFKPGQFLEIGLANFGEAPLAICSPPFQKEFFQICVRRVGQVTEALHRLKEGDFITFRGPFGNGFPKIENKNLLLIAGGLGLIPLRSLILSLLTEGFSNISIFYGAKTPEDFLFQDEFEKWQRAGIKLFLTIDKKYPGWKGEVGLVTVLFDKVNIPKETTAILCGPPPMYKFVIEKLKEKGIPDESIWLSLERKMFCGIGICQHCAIGSKYVCQDGPVFNYSEIKDIYNAI
ncbi:MAG: FAD/NAD(P)-binding protein [Patescibacteria group bacterium]